jgi:hypothetical protein
MAKFLEEKRAYPRVKSNVKVEMAKNSSADSVDLSEGGLSLSSVETIASPTLSLRINFADKKLDFKTNAKLVWKRNLEDGSSLYGMEFVNLNEIQKKSLREELIKIQTQDLLESIKDAETKKQVSNFFLQDVLNYISEIIALVPHLSKQDYSMDLEKKLDQLNTQILLKGYCLEELLSDKTVMQRIKENFRQLVGVWVYKSVIVKRGFDKPRGYPGDYQMLEIVYDNKPISRNIGSYFDNNFLKSPYAVAVRIRKNRLRELLEKFIGETKLNKFNIFNIACGSCREILELLPNLATRSSVLFTCLDWDEEALNFSRDILLPIAPQNVEFKFVKEDIMNMVKDEKVARSFFGQNLVYSIGLIDYLPDRVLKKLIQALYGLLQKDGKLILTHKNREKTFPSIPPDWFCDWKFVSRNKEEAVKLLYNCGISKFSLSIESDDFGYIYYFIITKI